MWIHMVFDMRQIFKNVWGYIAKFLFVIFRPLLSDIKPEFIYSNINHYFDDLITAAYIVYYLTNL